MKKFGARAILTFLIAAAGPAIAVHAEDKPGGTVKGAAVGAVAGHEMGGHTKSGAAVGAAVGHHERAKSEQQGK